MLKIVFSVLLFVGVGFMIGCSSKTEAPPAVKEVQKDSKCGKCKQCTCEDCQCCCGCCK